MNIHLKVERELAQSLLAEGKSLSMLIRNSCLPTRTSVNKVRWTREILFDPAFPPTWPELKAKTVEIFGQDGLPRSSKQWNSRVRVEAGCLDLKGRRPGRPSKKRAAK
jgi:hypothetical protein